MKHLNLKYTKIMLLGLVLNTSSHLFAQTQAPFSSPIEQQRSNTLILQNLNYKTVFMHLYQKDIRFLKMIELSMDQAVGLKAEDDQIDYAVLNPIVSYKNLQGEQRYIVHIERFKQEDGEINTGHPTHPIVELYLFKRLANGQYQMLSRTRPELDIVGSWGESYLTTQDFKSLQRIGRNQQGFFYSGGYTSTGSHTESTFLIVLNESGWIEEYPFGISEDNSGSYEENDPQYGQYSKEYAFVKNNAVQGLYPLQIIYSKVGNMDWRDNFPKNGFKEIVQFNPRKNCFVHGNSQCNVDLSD